MSIDWTLYLITDPELAGGRDKVVPIVQEAVRGGATVVQLRDKEASDEEVEATARELMKVLGGVPLFINDRAEVAAKVGCHLHIGQNDMDFNQARELLGPDKLIGLSVGTREELDAIDPQEAPDVIGIGPVHSTATKKNAPAGIGAEAARRLATAARERGIESVAIGGIKAHNAHELSASDFAGICVVSDIMAADDPAAAAHNLKEAYCG
ncbi:MULTISPECIES: thiamine phosphate synthase [unclassified Corynebacterium]|uniref:thiamine phosphate synthase n=1 Tax=Corynebacterium TaxID=1716 RepID=UPI00254DC3FF|nr:MULTISPECIES: thiamine phosphate synthase [unclassified Corynebacterium]MDK8452802.1 thiamine phosphate synthase [Corynebacterium sp. MSK084]MDK8514654.1 thiamine phosphate synthase [Corynebacterium sp. MSK123]MDK8547958.1 thiamine phosphate synthase [Corynebacterium sp. MSK222]MDK8647937.1 thiamine phosphate synthase [Corynebacterium sp. MSK082]MDK8698207.1 thiamine phosphate synthase [Corynebacterium sp. MSK192]